MQLPLQITFRDITSSPAVAEHIRVRAEKLDAMNERLTSCRVAIESPKRGTHHGKHYTVRIDLTMPRAELVIARHATDEFDGDLHVAIDRAFDRAQRVIHEHVRKHRPRHAATHAERQQQLERPPSSSF